MCVSLFQDGEVERIFGVRNELLQVCLADSTDWVDIGWQEVSGISPQLEIHTKRGGPEEQSYFVK